MEGIRARGERPPLKRFVVTFALGLLVALGPAPATAELSQEGDLFVTFDGGIAPRELPRRALAPISVRIEGKIRTLGRSLPPSLRRIRIALNSSGRLRSAGLPSCHADRIAGASPGRALANCGDALIGGGGFTAMSAIDEQPSVFLSGQILLFNAGPPNRPKILAHVYQSVPASITRIVVFDVRRKPGVLGTVIEGHLPPVLNRYGYMKSIFLNVSRSYVAGGRQRSYLSATCSAPVGVPVAAFPFARVSMGFEDGRTLASTLVRTCRPV